MAKCGQVVPFPAPEPEPEVVIRIGGQAYRVKLTATVEEVTGKQAEVTEIPQNQDDT